MTNGPYIISIKKKDNIPLLNKSNINIKKNTRKNFSPLSGFRINLSTS